ncbi:hypothetical protein [Pseudomonas sp. KNUC1026]|uniref:hypothetical protein n=1 Tax=Pseudomonas sp. KNUC1026 TaxID=2893890 RepID=UPI001F2A2600|nr:hypothetical protein [Pseudomonas sp. KNUC1026]UFH50101.1 hypothetical protein LN139_01705 [Pseudomonas sp. KNUC1026]
MDIWSWVGALKDELRESGKRQAVDSLDRMLQHIFNLEVAQARALLPEVKALAKSVDNPWLEVFVGHWEMRNRVGSLLEGETALPQVVALFERANREDARQCPQSVCVTQDLVACYANVDGAGWAEERIAVCDEALQRLAPSTGCFSCMSYEKADALLDGGRPKDALAFLNEQQGKILAAGQRIFSCMHEVRIATLLRLKRPEQAWAVMAEWDASAKGSEWPTQRQQRLMYKAQVLAQLQRDDEAWALLLAEDELIPRYRLFWLRALEELLRRAPERNTPALGKLLQEVIEQHGHHGAHRLVIQVAAISIPSALKRGDLVQARDHLTRAREHAGRLRRDCGAQALLESLAKQIDAVCLLDGTELR